MNIKLASRQISTNSQIFDFFVLFCRNLDLFFQFWIRFNDYFIDKKHFLANFLTHKVSLWPLRIWQNPNLNRFLVISKNCDIWCILVRVQDIQNFHTPRISIFLYLFCSPGFADSKSAIKNRIIRYYNFSNVLSEYQYLGWKF